MPEPIEVERERLRLHREWAESVERERVAQAEHDTRISERVKAFIATSAGDPAPTARAALIRHLDRLDRARHLAAASKIRLGEVSHASTRHSEAQTALAQLVTEVRAEFFAWLQYGGTGSPPPSRGAERDRLQRVLTEAEPLANLVGAAEFEHSVANVVVAELEAMSPNLRADVVYEAAEPVQDRIRSLVGELNRWYVQSGSIGACNRSLRPTVSRQANGRVAIAARRQGGAGHRPGLGRRADLEESPGRYRGNPHRRHSAATRRTTACASRAHQPLFREIITMPTIGRITADIAAGRVVPVNPVALAAFAAAGIRPPEVGQYTAAEVDAHLAGTTLTTAEKIAIKGHLRDAGLLVVTASVSASTGARPLPDTIRCMMASAGVALDASGTITLDRLNAEMASAPMGDRFTLKQALASTGRLTA